MPDIKFRIAIILSLSCLLAAFPGPLPAQENAMIAPYFQLQYFKNTNDQRSLKATLTYSFERMELPIPGMAITFYSIAGQKKNLGTVLTDSKGSVSFDLESTGPLPVNNEGKWGFAAEFSGNDSIDAVSSEVFIRDVKMDMEFSEIDSVKTISLAAYVTENGEAKPASGELIMVYVPRMFSLLPVGEAYLDDYGKTTLDFPSDLPGDTAGNVTVIARIEEHADFGNVERSSIQKWGKPFVDTTPVAHRALWTKTPPWWMIITLSILLAGVWSHYLYAIISLILIKREANREKKLKDKSDKNKIAR